MSLALQLPDPAWSAETYPDRAGAPRRARLRLCGTGSGALADGLGASGPPAACAPVAVGAQVFVLQPPLRAAQAAPLRLTRRGVTVVCLTVAVLGAALAWLAAVSAPVASTAPAAVVHSIIVRPGDTLWSIASSVAPGRDPRAEIEVLQRANGLTGDALVPGQTLRVP